MNALEEADGYKILAGNIRHGTELKGQVVFDHPGSKTVSSLTSRLSAVDWSDNRNSNITAQGIMSRHDGHAVTETSSMNLSQSDPFPIYGQTQCPAVSTCNFNPSALMTFRIVEKLGLLSPDKAL